ncbi:MAG: hypothetical protein AAB675_02510 [Patescibacteria group bacterium]
MLAELERKVSPENAAQFTWIRQSLKEGKELILVTDEEKLTVKIGDPKMIPFGRRGEVLVFDHTLLVNAQGYSVFTSESFSLDEDGLLIYGSSMRSNFIAFPFLMNSIVFTPKAEGSKATQEELDEHDASKSQLERRALKVFERMVKQAYTPPSS